MSARDLAKGVARALGLRVSRNRLGNRFQAVDECLVRLKALGYRPEVVVDVGANEGQFFRLAQRIFPHAHYHLIEPQPACGETLRSLASADPGVEYHPFALTEPSVSAVQMLGVGNGGGSTGAYVAKIGEKDSQEIRVSAATLDVLFSNRLKAGRTALLKLDVESHELSVLRGSTATLEKVDVILMEVGFFDVENRGNPGLYEILVHLEERAFELYDVASLSDRPRDHRLRMGDLLFVRRGTPLVSDNAWE